MTAKYPNLIQVESGDLDIIAICFCGAYQGINDHGATASAANQWWGGGSYPGTGLMVPINDSETNATQVGFRRKVYLSDMQTNSILEDYWYVQNTGDVVKEQLRVEQWIDLLSDAGVTVLNPLYYSRTADIPDRNGIPVSEKIWHWFDYYMTARNKNKLKFVTTVISLYASFDSNSPTFFPVTAGTWNNLPNMAAYWASLAQDPQYYYTNLGQPVLYYIEQGPTWTQPRFDVIDAAFVSAVGVAPYYVNAFGSGTMKNALTHYKPQLVATNQTPYKTRADKDVTVDAGVPSRAFQPYAVLFEDSRPVGAGGYWVDNPTYTEVEKQFRRKTGLARVSRGFGDRIRALYFYAAFEEAEGGVFLPTYQNIVRGVNSPMRGPALDALRNVKRQNLPSTYEDHYHANSLNVAFTRTGTWTTTENINNGGGIGAQTAPFEFKLHRTSVAATLSFTPLESCTQIRIYGTLGPGLGTFNAQTDGGGATLVNQSAISTTYNQLLYDTGVLAPGSHTVLLTRVSGTVELDEVVDNVSR
jgi:hypothetical protein